MPQARGRKVRKEVEKEVVVGAAERTSTARTGAVPVRSPHQEPMVPGTVCVPVCR